MRPALLKNQRSCIYFIQQREHAFFKGITDASPSDWLIVANKCHMLKSGLFSKLFYMMIQHVAFEIKLPTMYGV